MFRIFRRFVRGEGLKIGSRTRDLSTTLNFTDKNSAHAYRYAVGYRLDGPTIIVYRIGLFLFMISGFANHLGDPDLLKIAPVAIGITLLAWMFVEHAAKKQTSRMAAWAPVVAVVSAAFAVSWCIFLDIEEAESHLFSMLIVQWVGVGLVTPTFRKSLIQNFAIVAIFVGATLRHVISGDATDLTQYYRLLLVSTLFALMGTYKLDYFRKRSFLDSVQRERQERELQRQKQELKLIANRLEDYDVRKLRILRLLWDHAADELARIVNLSIELERETNHFLRHQKADLLRDTANALYRKQQRMVRYHAIFTRTGDRYKKLVRAADIVERAILRVPEHFTGLTVDIVTQDYVRVDETQTIAALEELVANSLQAIDVKRMSMPVDEMRLFKETMHVSCESVGGTIIISITDNGEPPDEECLRLAMLELEHLVEPDPDIVDVATLPLGLRIVSAALKNQNALLHFEFGPEDRTTAVVQIPVAATDTDDKDKNRTVRPLKKPEDVRSDRDRETRS